MILVSEEDIRSKMPCDKSGVDLGTKNCLLAMHIVSAIYQEFLPANTVRQLKHFIEQ